MLALLSKTVCEKSTVSSGGCISEGSSTVICSIWYLSTMVSVDRQINRVLKGVWHSADQWYFFIISR